MDASLTLFREKSLVFRLGNGPKDPPVFELRSNRLTMTMKAGQRSDDVVVRGRTVPSTLRMAAIVADSYARQPTIFSKENHDQHDWKGLWLTRQNPYERRFMPDSWVSLHTRDETLFTTNPLPAVDILERLARGNDLGEKMVHQAAAELLNETNLEDLIVQHDSQTAFVFTPFKEYLRAAVLERREGRTGSFSASVYHPAKPEPPVSAAAFIGFCADISEAIQIRAFHERVKSSLDGGRAASTRNLAAQVEAAMARRKDVMQFIVAFERANKVTWRPERPAFF